MKLGRWKGKMRHDRMLKIGNNIETSGNTVDPGKETNMEAPVMRRALLLFAETVLRPIIRILLRYGLSYPEFNQIGRKLFVDIAMQEPEFWIPRRRRQYKSRVALLTALSRKEVLRLVDGPRPADDASMLPSNRAARVLEGWLTDARFTDARGAPLVLPFRAASDRRSFSVIVNDYSGDIPPRAILDELVRTGTCATSGDDEIRVARPAYVARPVDVEEITSAAMRAASSLARIDVQLAPAMDVKTAAGVTPIRQAAY